MSTHYKTRPPSGCAGVMEAAAWVPGGLVVVAAVVVEPTTPAGSRQRFRETATRRW